MDSVRDKYRTVLLPTWMLAVPTSTNPNAAWKSVRRRVRMSHVDFADNPLVSGSNGMFEQIVVRLARAAAPG